MAKKIFTDESLSTFVSEVKSYTDEAVSTKADSTHTHAASDITSGTLSTDRLPTIPVAKGGVPSYTTDNNEQFLRVVDGVAAWDSVPNAEDNTFGGEGEEYVESVESRVTTLETDVDSLNTSVTSLETSVTSQANQIATIQSTIADHESRIRALEAITCLIKGTQILMADGTTKNIEDVQYGDMIKSWDLENNEYIDVKSYGCIRTGIANQWKAHCFTNGEIVKIFNTHNIYCKELGSLKQSRSWTEGKTAIGYEGAETQLAFVLDLEESEYKERYVLMSENDLYFADGILCGQHARAKIAYWSIGLFKANEEEVAEFRETAALYDEVNNARFDPDYLKKSLEIRTKRRLAENDIKNCESELAKRDYKTIKHAQGQLNDAEQEENVARCNELRANINARQAEIKQYNKEWNAIKAEVPNVRRSVHDTFKAAYALDMQRIRARRQG